MTIWQQQQHQLTSTIETRKRTNLFVFLFPATAWLLLFFIVPLLIVLLYSFLERGTYGGITWEFTLRNYQRVTSGLYLGVVWRSIWLALITTVAC